MMRRLAPYSAALTLAFLLVFSCSAWAQRSLPPDSKSVKSPQEAFKGGAGMYLASQGFDLLKQGRSEEAIKAFREAIQHKPDYAEAHEGLARAYGNLKRWPEAIASFRQAIQLKPDFYEAYTGLGLACGMVSRNKEALLAFKEAVRLNPNLALAHWGLANTYLALGDRNAALAEHKILQKLDPAMAARFDKYLYPAKK
jgi:tetratricopeptide (TPR) repeat protein